MTNDRLNPFYEEPQENISKPLEVLGTRTPRHRSIFMHLLITFFVLALIPTLFYLLFGVIVYVGIRPFVHLPEGGALEKILFIQILLTFLLVTIAVIFVASLTSSAIIRPVRRLLAFTRLIAEGKLNYRLQVSRRDEIGELTDAFNMMVARLREHQAREKLISQLKSEFISVSAHQLRTPLSAVKWTFRMMLDGDVGDLTKGQKEFLERGYETNENMIRLVNDLLNVARIEEGHFGYEFVPTDIAAYLKKMVANYQHAAESRSLEIIFEEPPEFLPLVNIDPSKMDLVLQNLLDNSVKYSHTHGTIRVRVAKGTSHLSVSVIDEGVGIPRRQLDRVFSKFFRGDNVVRMETQGSGLGLFIVRNIVRNHGGDINIESEENKGTTITFTIPLIKELVPKKEMIPA